MISQVKISSLVSQYFGTLSNGILTYVSIVFLNLIFIGIFLFLSLLNSEIVLGLVLLGMSVFFFFIGLALLGKIGDKQVGVMNLVGSLFFLLAAFQLYTLGLVAVSALIAVFALIYFMVAGVFVFGYDGKGLGWYCLFATVVFVWYAYHFFDLGAAGMWFAIFSLAWALLVLLAFFALALGKALAPLVAWIFIIEAILTLLIPGILLLTEKWNPFGGVPG